MMYQVIFTHQDSISPDGCQTINSVPGMRTTGVVPHLSFAPNNEALDSIRSHNPHIVGIWDEFGEAIEFDPIAYREALEDIREYDSEGSITSLRRPTEEDAHTIHVCSFAGWNPRHI